METDPIDPQDFKSEFDAYCLEQQQIAEAQYQDYLRERGITQAEHEAEVMHWCDIQD